MERTKLLLVWLQSFLMCKLGDTDMLPHGRFVCQDQREGWKSKGSVFWGSTLDSNLFRKETQNQCLPLRRESGSASSPLFIVPPSADTAKLKDCSCVFTKASSPPRPQSDLRPFHQHCLPLKATFILGHRREKKAPLGSEIALSPKKESLLR